MTNFALHWSLIFSSFAFWGGCHVFFSTWSGVQAAPWPFCASYETKKKEPHRRRGFCFCWGVRFSRRMEPTHQPRPHLSTLTRPSAPLLLYTLPCPFPFLKLMYIKNQPPLSPPPSPPPSTNNHPTNNPLPFHTMLTRKSRMSVLAMAAWMSSFCSVRRLLRSEKHHDLWCGLAIHTVRGGGGGSGGGGIMWWYACV